jgi:hypothetical protein
VKALGFFIAILGSLILAIVVFIGGGVDRLLQNLVLHWHDVTSHDVLFLSVFLWPIFLGLALIFFGDYFLSVLNMTQGNKQINITEFQIPERFKDEKMSETHSEVAARDFLNPLPIGNIDRAGDEDADADKGPAVGEVAKEMPSGNDGHDHFGVSKRSKK